MHGSNTTSSNAEERHIKAAVPDSQKEVRSQDTAVGKPEDLLRPLCKSENSYGNVHMCESAMQPAARRRKRGQQQRFFFRSREADDV